MSIYIKGWDLPKEPSLYYVAIIHHDGTVEDGMDPQRMRKCKAIQVPEHGRLIDGDALDKKCEEMAQIAWNNHAAPYSWAYAYGEFQADVETAPTIIPADEPENKEGE